MNEKLKLPVRVAYLPPAVTTPVLLDSNDIRVSLQDAADALNATARRCDQCIHWKAHKPTPACDEPSCGRCHFTADGEPAMHRDADDWCRKGWEPR